MPKDLARTDYVNEFIDLLEKHAPTTPERQACARWLQSRARR